MNKKLLAKLQSAKKRLAGCKWLTASFSKQTQKTVMQEPQVFLEKSLSAAYHLIGDKAERFLPLFKDLDKTLQKTGLKINFKAYVSLAILSSLSTAVAVAATLFISLFYVFSMSLISALLFSLGSGLLAGAFSIIGFYLYPVYHADKHKRELEDELPFTTGYMAILASAGVSPEKIFYSISNLNVPLAVSTEANEIVKNINLFGLDVISALEKASKRTPSEKLREIIEGIISTIHTGGSMSTFLRGKFKVAMKLKKLSLKKYADNLSILSEIYVALLLTGPLLLVVMVSVMSVMGGSLGPLSPDLLLSFLTYLVIPVCATVFLIILDSTSPKW
ncbi:MAG: type II secretion system F family protein [Candidatus Bathyarchaeota archaeon]|nr:type II secretion system F family protein [Candidatus Bathyarchaeota archaeon]